MNRHFRTISALLRNDWAVDEAWANSQLPLIHSYLSGHLTSSMMGSDEQKKPLGYVVTSTTKLSASDRSQVSTGKFIRHQVAADQANASTHSSTAELFGDESIAPGSIAILDVRGPIMKEGFCGSYGTEDYTAAMKAVYANENLIGAVILVDSGGGQLSGTPSFYDAIRNPAKPTGVIVNDGLMASAAYWLGCGADFIWASQPTDQIGSIGVFCRLRDNTEYLKQNGIREFSVYASRSVDKNRPIRDAIKGDTKLLTAELDQSVDHFEVAVRQGRGDKLKITESQDPFTGKLYSADEAIAIGLIDGYGDLDAALAKVEELAAASKSPSPGNSVSGNTPTDFSAQTPALAASGLSEDITPQAQGQATDSNSNPQTNDDMFGDKHKKLSALAGLEASAITDEVLNDVNANLDELKITGARVISSAYLQEAESAIAALAAANTKIGTLESTITTLTQERNDAREEAQKFGAQPGHLGSKSPKESEKMVEGQQAEDPYFSETDAEAARLRAQVKAMQ